MADHTIESLYARCAEAEEREKRVTEARDARGRASDGPAIFAAWERYLDAREHRDSHIATDEQLFRGISKAVLKASVSAEAGTCGDREFCAPLRKIILNAAKGESNG